MTWQAVSRMYNAEALLHDATISMGHFLLNVDSQEGSYASEIAPALGMEGTSLSRLIQSLDAKKMITRMEDKADKRKTKIMLTKKGILQKERAKNAVRSFNHTAEQKIGKEKLAVFFKVLDEIAELAEQRNKLLKK